MTVLFMISGVSIRKRSAGAYKGGIKDHRGYVAGGQSDGNFADEENKIKQQQRG